MKISGVDIIDYQQFKNFKLDFTYPLGHVKAGQPLDKVCFIGQSGTGKTTLLNLIRAIVSCGLIKENYLLPAMKDVWAETHFEGNINRHVHIKDGVAEVENDRLDIKRKRKVNTKQLRQLAEQHYKDTNILISFPAEMNTNISRIFRERRKIFRVSDTFRNFSEPSADVQESSQDEDNLHLKFFDFEKNDVEEIWAAILKDIQAYKTEQLVFSNELANRIDTRATEVETLIEKFKIWKEGNPNPLADLAQKLNKILYRFNLEIRSEFEFRSEDDLHFINLHQIKGEEIPNRFWSTGTKQIILTATPLFKLNTEKSIILIDEPERSLYPDVQQEIVDYYSDFAPKAQFFYATHSPIVASSFDPWEIFELKFDPQTGNIVQESYLKEGQPRHIDNYKIYPKYLRWDSILQQVFDLENDGQNERELKIRELSELDVRLRTLRAQKNGEPSPELENLWNQFKKTAELLDWKIPESYAKN